MTIEFDGQNNKITRDTAGSIKVDRKTSDGDIVELQKDGTSVGTIGTTSGNLTLDGGSGKTGLRVANVGIIPRDNGSDANGTVDLGANGIRFNNVFLNGNVVVANGGGIYFGATTPDGTSVDSELLDDYEEGTWTPVFLGGTGNPTVSYSTQEGRYTKIGNLVYVQAYALVNTTSGGSGNLRLGGLPFTAVNASSRGFASIALTNIESTIVVTQLIDPNSTYSILRKGNQPSAEIQVSDLANGEYLWYSGVYQVS